MISNPLSVLITRPEQQGLKLAKQLQTMGMNTQVQPMFDYQPFSNKAHIQALLTSHSPQIVIFVSVAAVKFANAIWSLNTWQVNTIIAVGQATQLALQQLNIDSIINEQCQDSDGVLSLKTLNQVADKNILIVRGNGGREHLAQTLAKRGAKVQYFESYQRIWRTFTEDITKQWQIAKINCIVITSNALLESIVQLIQNKDKYWRHTCLWIVASERIADNAKRLGLGNIFNANGASDEAIISALQTNTKTALSTD